MKSVIAHSPNEELDIPQSMRVRSYGGLSDSNGEILNRLETIRSTK